MKGFRFTPIWITPIEVSRKLTFRKWGSTRSVSKMFQFHFMRVIYNELKSEELFQNSSSKQEHQIKSPLFNGWSKKISDNNLNMRKMKFYG